MENLFVVRKTTLKCFDDYKENQVFSLFMFSFYFTF